MATVKWVFLEQNPNYDAGLVEAFLDVEPKRVLPQVLSDPKRAYATVPDGRGMYGKCYSFLEYFKNVYALCAPFDVALTVDENGTVTETKLGGNHAALSGFMFFRSDPSPDTNILLSLYHQYIFYSDEEVIIEQLPPFMDFELMKQGVTVIPGSFDISKWVRPVEVALEVAKGVRSVVIPAGTPLTYVRFISKDKGTVKLERAKHTAELQALSNKCTGLKTIRPKQSLQQCYEYGKRIVDAFIRPKRCPFRRK